MLYNNIEEVAKMKKAYIVPEIELRLFDDIITTSLPSLFDDSAFDLGNGDKGVFDDGNW
jgi:hypothetical protein